jgi:hypothetical protein
MPGENPSGEDDKIYVSKPDATVPGISADDDREGPVNFADVLPDNEPDGAEEFENLMQNFRDMENSPDADAVKNALVEWGAEHGMPVQGDASTELVGGVFEDLVDSYIHQKESGLEFNNATVSALSNSLLNRIAGDLAEDPATRVIAERIRKLAPGPVSKKSPSPENDDVIEAQKLHIQDLEADLRRAMAEKAARLAHLHKILEKDVHETQKALKAVDSAWKSLETAKNELVNALGICGYRGSSEINDIKPDFHFDAGRELVMDNEPNFVASRPEAQKSKNRHFLDQKLVPYNEANLFYSKANLDAEAAAAEQQKTVAEIDAEGSREDTRIARLQQALDEAKRAARG